MSAGRKAHDRIDRWLRTPVELRGDAEQPHPAWLQWYRDAGEPWLLSEVAVALDPSTGWSRLLPTVSESGEPLGHREAYRYAEDYEIPGTLDAMAGDGVAVYEWKLASGGGTYPDGTVRAGLVQLTTQLAAHPAWSGTSPPLAAHGELVEVRSDRDAAPVHVVELGRIARRAHLARLARALGDATDPIGPPEPRPGEHCARYHCAQHGLCPATRGALAVVAHEHVPVPSHPSAIETDEDARRVYVTIRDARAELARWTEAVDRAAAVLEAAVEARGGALDLGDGSRYVRTEARKRTIRDLSAVPGAWHAFQEALGDRALSAVSLKTSIEAIRDALRPVAPKRGLSAAVDALMVRLTELGAVNETSYSTWRVLTSKPEKE